MFYMKRLSVYPIKCFEIHFYTVLDKDYFHIYSLNKDYFHVAYTQSELFSISNICIVMYLCVFLQSKTSWRETSDIRALEAAILLVEWDWTAIGEGWPAGS